MKRETIKKLLGEVKEGRIEVDAALERLKDLPYEELGFATIDHHREIRQGMPEVIFCPGKGDEQIYQIITRMEKAGSDILATRAERRTFDLVRTHYPQAEYNEMGKTIVIRVGKPRPLLGEILIITAGTSDLPVAEEARVTANLLGSKTLTLYDYGVAGLHRLLDKRETLQKARVIIVVAGMEGALASVVGGLVEGPVIAVPTSRGYGSSFGGVSALLSMLNSCAALAVVNIDNGFGAALLAHRINMLGEEKTP